MFKKVDSKASFYEMQKRVLDYWRRNKIFEKSVNSRSKDNIYSFYDGPPFITGLPHYATLLPSIAKDVIPRFWTMKGKRVRRVWGWDCHGIYAEVQVEKKLGLKGRSDIEKMGIDNFINECRSYVSEVSSQWKWYIDHIGRWVDMDNAYRTMDRDYMESVIWAFKEAYTKGYIFKGRRTSLFCPRCSTPLSNFEVTMDGEAYTEIEENTVIVKFALSDGSKALAWTTTPWTLPANLALAVNEDVTYARIRFKGDSDTYVLSVKSLENMGLTDYKVEGEFKGKELVGLSYSPLFDFFNVSSNKKNFRIYGGEFVSDEEGTGIVHIAPNLGEEDFLLGQKHKLSQIDSVDETGRMVEKIKPWARLYFRDANPRITQYLREKGVLFSSFKHTHRYPFCHRCKAPLIYRAQDAWYVDIKRIKKRMLEHNDKINWVPGHFKHGRFEYNVKSAPDWCISRTRYWGTPIPIWECSCGNMEVFGSVDEIEKASGREVKDLHRPDIDEIKIPCGRCGKEMSRVREVLDPWFESGSMPFAERHYPFENKGAFKKSFPADFIVEYTGQLRAWFYYLLAVSTMLFDSEPFKNVVVTGVLLGTDGRKMSKSLGNYPDPKGVLEKYGGEALRLFLMSSPIMVGEDITVREEDIAEHYRKSMLILWNSYKYFVTYANSCGFDGAKDATEKGGNILDTWIKVRLEEFIENFNNSLEKYDYISCAKAFRPFVEDLSTWYIRRSRDRFVAGDKNALNTLYMVLLRFVSAAAPLIPFTAEEIYQNLASEEKGSVHLLDYPNAESGFIRKNRQLMDDMRLLRAIVEKIHSKRHEAGIKLRQPLGKVSIKCPDEIKTNGLIEILLSEVNVKEAFFGKGGALSVSLDTEITDDLKLEGGAREMIRAFQKARKEAGSSLSKKVVASYPNGSFENDVLKKFKKEIMSKALLKDIVPGDKYEIIE